MALHCLAGAAVCAAVPSAGWTRIALRSQTALFPCTAAKEGGHRPCEMGCLGSTCTESSASTAEQEFRALEMENAD